MALKSILNFGPQCLTLVVYSEQHQSGYGTRVKVVATVGAAAPEFSQGLNRERGSLQLNITLKLTTVNVRLNMVLPLNTVLT